MIKNTEKKLKYVDRSIQTVHNGGKKQFVISKNYQIGFGIFIKGTLFKR